MLRPGADPLVPTLFEQPYLTKPPGIVWAIALSSRILGETELAARAPSALAATLGALAAYFFAGRWFGWRYALWAALAHVLTPQGWWFSRAAEIEALNNLAAQVSLAALLDVALGHGRTAILLLGVASGLLMWLCKGPAGASTLAAGVLAVALLDRSRGPLALASIVALAPPALFAILVLVLSHRLEGLDVVRQGVTEFLWSDTRPRAIGEVFALAPTAWALALPASLAILFPFGPALARERARDTHRETDFALALALACVLSLLLLAAAGVRNPRYALPAMVPAPFLAAYVARGVFTHAFERRRARIARCLLHPALWIPLLAAGAVLFIVRHEPALRQSSGREAGLALGGHFEPGREVWADHLVSARPEVLHYARREARSRGHNARVRWIPNLGGTLPAPGDFVVLRRDATTDEEAAYRAAGLWHRLEPVHVGRVHEFEFTLFRVNAAGTPP